MNAASRYRVFFLLGCALACCAAGVDLVLREDAPAIGITAAGELIYPQSAGSGDCMFLGLGLMSFGFTAYAALWAMWSGSARRKLPWLYIGNLAVFLAMLWLVLLDSDLIDAARMGDAMPLLSLLPALAPAGWLIAAGAAHLARAVFRPARPAD